MSKAYTLADPPRRMPGPGDWHPPEPNDTTACTRCNICDPEPDSDLCEECGWLLHGPRQELIDEITDLREQVRRLKLPSGGGLR